MDVPARPEPAQHVERRAGSGREQQRLDDREHPGETRDATLQDCRRRCFRIDPAGNPRVDTVTLRSFSIDRRLESLHPRRVLVEREVSPVVCATCPGVFVAQTQPKCVCRLGPAHALDRGLRDATLARLPRPAAGEPEDGTERERPAHSPHDHEHQPQRAAAGRRSSSRFESAHAGLGTGRTRRRATILRPVPCGNAETARPRSPRAATSSSPGASRR